MLRNTAETVGVRLARLVLALASGLISARFLGTSGRGEYFFVVTVAALVVQFGNIGLHASNTYYVARDRRLLPGLIGNSLTVALVVGVAGGAVVAAVVQAMYGVALTEAVFVPLLAAATLFYLLGTNLLVGLQRIRTFNAFELGSNLLLVLLLLTLAVAAPAVTSFLAASATAWIAAAAVLLAVLWRVAATPPTVDTGTLRMGFRYAVKAYVAALLAFLVLRSNVFVLQGMAGTHELGLFSIATQIADVLAIVPTSVALILFPQLVVSAENSWPRTVRVAKIVAVGSTAAAALTAIVSAPLIELLFGDQFTGSSAMLLAMLPGTVALAALTVMSQYLAAIGFPRALIASWFFALVFVLSASALLVPQLGGRGSALALSGTYAILLVLVVLIGRRYGTRRA